MRAAVGFLFFLFLLDWNRSSMTAFPNIPKIAYEGPTSKYPLAFRWYQ